MRKLAFGLALMVSSAAAAEGSCQAQCEQDFGLGTSSYTKLNNACGCVTAQAKRIDEAIDFLWDAGAEDLIHECPDADEAAQMVCLESFADRLNGSKEL